MICIITFAFGFIVLWHAFRKAEEEYEREIGELDKQRKTLSEFLDKKEDSVTK